MRTIFITPLLWKRVDRAMRRRNEGQALVLVALTAVGMVAMVGLAIDGGLAFMEAQKIQRAADAAALAGAVWMPSLKSIADARGELATQANGYDAVNHGTTTQATASADQTGDTIYYVGSGTDVPTQYQATVGHVAHRWFLGIIGFGNFYIQRSAIAQYSSLPKLGSSDNYLGDSVLFNEHDRLDINGINALLAQYNLGTCSKSNPPSWGGGGNDAGPAWLHYYCGLYLHLLYQSCQMRPGGPNSSSTLPCLGTFWLNIFSPEIFTENGDAYSPGMVGGDITHSNPEYGGNVLVNSNHGSNFNKCTAQLLDSETWYYNLVDTSSNTCQQSSAYNYPGSNPAYVNYNQQPDAPTITSTNSTIHNFGYEIAIQVAPDAIVSDSTLISSGGKGHTALNVSIYGAGGYDVGSDITFGSPSQYSTQSSWSGSNGIDPRFYGGAVNGVISSTDLVTENNPAARVVGTVISNTIQGSVAQSGAPGASTNPQHVPIDRESVTRFMLFLPPTSPGTATTWSTKGVPVHATNGTNNSADEYTTDAPGNATGTALIGPDLNWFGVNAAIPQPVTNTMQSYGNGIPCSQWNNFNDQLGNGLPLISYFDSGTYKNCTYTSGTSNVPGWEQYCYVVDPEWLDPLGQSGSRLATAGQALTYNFKLFYVCPPHGTGASASPADRYWNQLYGSPSASVVSSNSRFTTNGTTVRPVESTMQSMYFTGTYAYGNNVLSNTNTYYDLGHTVDPGQACRSITDSYWGNDRIPFNMRGADWTSQVINSGTPVTVTNNLTTTNNLSNQLLLTQYFSYHGERCSWDFDSAASNDTNGPDFNPINPVSANTQGGMNGCKPQSGSSNTSDLGRLLDSPYITSFAVYDTQIDTVWQSPLAAGGEPFENVSCYEPFFHITNWHFDKSGNEVYNPTDSAGDQYQKTLWLEGGTYLLHVQVYGGLGQHRYAVKAEYENPAPVQLPLAGTTTLETQYYSVPSVYGIGNFSIYTNGRVDAGKTNDVIFDLASIPPQNHDFTAILEMWDVGDVGSNLTIGLLRPSGYGKGYGYQYQDTNDGGKTKFIDPTSNDGLDTLSTRAITITQLNIYPYNSSVTSYKSINQNNLTHPSQTMIWGTESPYGGLLNAAWADLVFQLPSTQYYTDLANTCDANEIPESDCYFFQVDYHLISTASCYSVNTGTSSVNNCDNQYADDTTTWQLYIQNQPVHLVS